MGHRGQVEAGTEQGHSGTHQHPHRQGWACKGLKPKQGSLGWSWEAQTCGLSTTQGLEPCREGQGLAPQQAAILTIQSRHDGLAQREHQPQWGTKEEEAGYLKFEAGAGTLRPIQRHGAALGSLCLQRGLAGLQAGTAETVGRDGDMGRDGNIVLPLS